MLLKSGRQRGPNRARDALTRAVIEAVDQTGLDMAWIERRAGVGKQALSHIRTGARNPRAETLASVLEAAGLDFRIVDRNTPPAQPVYLPAFLPLHRTRTK